MTNFIRSIVHGEIGAMALAFQSGESVKQALFEELQNLLNADKDIRTNAEGRIKQLEFTEGKTEWKYFSFSTM